MQDFIVYLIIAGAAFYLLKMLWSAAAGKKSGCNSCGSNCASQTTTPPEGSTPSAAPLLQIELSNLNGHHKK